jgi:hypothetical protein
MTQRLVETLREMSVYEMAQSQSEWMPAFEKAQADGVTTATIYNRIKRKELDAVNFKGRIFVRKSLL